MVLTRSGATSDGMDQHIPSVDRGIAGESETLLSASGVAHMPPGAPPPPTAGPCGASTSTAPFAQSPAPPVQPGTPIVMTDQHLAYLLSLIRAPASPPAPVTSALSGNFANCSSRFDGAKGSDVLAFVDAIEIYKECVGIEDHIALRGLPMLLSGLAATWWQGVKASVNSWPDAIELLKQTYGPRLPPHRVYRKIFEREQGDEPTDIFVCKIRALLAQLPSTAISQEAQLDMVYGLLHKRIREKICRKSFMSFSELLEQARSIEDILDEGRSSQQSQLRRNKESVTPIVDTANPAVPASSSKASRARCYYCKQFGHLKEECPKLLSKKSFPSNIKKEEDNLTPSVTCFGCGTPGVIRASCPTCKNKQGSSASFSAFQSIAAIGSEVIDPRQRPVVELEIYGARGSALFDTGAKQSVASESLRAHLVKHGHNFDKTCTSVKLADGSCKDIVVDIAKVDVRVPQGPVVPTLFIVLPGATDTLLGMNFLLDAGVVLDFKNSRYTFSNIPRYFTMRFEPEVGRLACSAIELSGDKGSHFVSEERQRFSEPLNDHVDIFTLGGGPTSFSLHRNDIDDAAPIASPPSGVIPAMKEIKGKRHKPSNQKPAGLLGTPVPQQRFEVLAMDILGPLPTGNKGERFIFLVENTATRWVGVFPLVTATAEACAKLLVEEVFLRYGLPRRVISDNGSQFVSAVLQKVMFVLGIKRNLLPIYHPKANPAERKNRDMKQTLAMLVGPEHRNWPEVLPTVRFVLNTAYNQGTGKSVADITFARDLRSPLDPQYDLRQVVVQEKHVPQITQYLKPFCRNTKRIGNQITNQQRRRKIYADRGHRTAPNFKVGDLVLVSAHVPSNVDKGVTRKFAPRRLGPFKIAELVSPTTYKVVDNNGNTTKYHASALTLYQGDSAIIQSRRRGRPSKAKSSPGVSEDLEGETIARPVDTVSPMRAPAPPSRRSGRLTRPPAKLRS